MNGNIHPQQISLFDFVQDGIALNRLGGGVKSCHKFDEIISVENLLISWQEFLRGKRRRKDVIEFSLRLTDNIISLHRELGDKTYRHGPYQAFKINDPKPRDIHKASVRDRLVHHAIYRILYPYFDRKFIFDSYSCRKDKGTHRAIRRSRVLARKVSQNNTRTVWILKCDIRKFFANIDHAILKEILAGHIGDPDILWLLERVINSFYAKNVPGVGLPLGNLTSQLLVNIYMDVFDEFVKRELKVGYYIRYADDFIFLHWSRGYLENLVLRVSEFLNTKLKLSLHPCKVCIKTLASGVDFLGWINFPRHRVLRTSTRRRMLKRLRQCKSRETLTSYLGLISYGNTYKLMRVIEQDADD